MSASMLLAALSAVALLAACSTGPGPLGGGGTPGEACMAFALGKPVTTGMYDLTNTGTTPVTIQRFELPGDTGLTLSKKTWLVPIYHDSKTGNFIDVGVGAAHPPTTSPEWPHRRPAIGGMIRPGQDLTLVFGLTRTTVKPGHSDGPMIAYSAGGSSYTVKEKTSLMVAGKCS